MYCMQAHGTAWGTLRSLELGRILTRPHGRTKRHTDIETESKRIRQSDSVCHRYPNRE